MIHFFENSNLSLQIADVKLIEQKETQFHKLIILDHKLLGKILILDNEIQHVEKWAPLYHEVLVHLPISFQNEIQRVLILGGGSLFTANEVLKYKSVKKVDMIDHDQEVIESINRHGYLHAKKVLQDQRLNIIFEDGKVEIEKIHSKYDLIINDCFDFVKLFRKRINLFTKLYNLLKENGICSDVIYRHIFELDSTKNTIKAISNYRAVFSLVFIPEYPGVLHLQTLWGKNINLKQTVTKTVNIEQKSWVKNPDISPLEFYNPQCLSYYLYLPPYLKKAIGYSFS